MALAAQKVDTRIFLNVMGNSFFDILKIDKVCFFRIVRSKKNVFTRKRLFTQKIHDTLFQGGWSPSGPLKARKMARVSQNRVILRSAESRIILGLGRNIAQIRV